MPPRTYGSKRRPVVAAGSSKIFGEVTDSSVESVTGLLASTRLEVEEENVSLQSAHSSPLPFALSLDAQKDDKQKEDDEVDEEESVCSENAHSAATDPALEGLEPLTAAHKIDTGNDLVVLPWKSVLPKGSSIIKIAEASYAEVYRVTTKSSETSIIKILQLKVPADEASYEMETANVVENVVSEIRIMNSLTEVPGFVTFKGTYVVQGPPPKKIIDAHNAHLENLHEESEEGEEGENCESNFPHPATAFNEHSTFLVLELGDAGSVLESYPMTTIDQVWDVFLGVIMALSRAEITNKFEHRDLHENNICVRVNDRDLPNHKTVAKTTPDLKFGFSGYSITLIDYGLSRAELGSGDIIYNDLESDLEVFHSVETGIAGTQFDTYRRMRTHMIDGTHTMKPVAWHSETSLPAEIQWPWKKFMPYTNVLWIRYIFLYLTANFDWHTGGGDGASKFKRNPVLIRFKAETSELSKRLNPKTKVTNGAFTSAQEVLTYVVEQGWVSVKQLETFGVEDSLRDVSTFIDEGVESSDSDVLPEDDSDSEDDSE